MCISNELLPKAPSQRLNIIASSAVTFFMKSSSLFFWDDLRGIISVERPEAASDDATSETVPEMFSSFISLPSSM